MISLGPLRGRVAVARNHAGRAATAAGTAAAAATALDPHWYGYGMAGALFTATGGLLWATTLPKGRIRDASMALYLTPAVSLAVLLTCERLVRGGWWELLADAAWTVAVWWNRPARLARVLANREPSLAPEAVAQALDQVDAPSSAHPMSIWWAQRVATEGGPGVGTALQDIEWTGPASLRGVIRSTIPGTPVPAISTQALSALLDWPEDQIAIAPIPGRGAGVRHLTVGQAPVAITDLHSAWTDRIAPKGMPNTVITKIRAVEVPDPETSSKELHA